MTRLLQQDLAAARNRLLETRTNFVCYCSAKMPVRFTLDLAQLFFRPLYDLFNLSKRRVRVCIKLALTDLKSILALPPQRNERLKESAFLTNLAIQVMDAFERGYVTRPSEPLFRKTTQYTVQHMVVGLLLGKSSLNPTGGTGFNDVHSGVP